MREVAGTAVLITGGSKGIGLATAEALVDAGAHVAITARDAELVRETAERLGARGGGRAIGVPTDVRDLAQQEHAVAETLAAFGRLDALIANAGVGRFGSIADLSVEDWHTVIDTNLTGVFYSIKATLDALTASQGTIVTIGSLAGANFFAGGSAYNASKFGLTGFTQAVMLDLRDRGIKVSTIMPGSVATSFGGREPSSADAWKIQGDDIAEMVVYLLRTHPRALPSKIEVRPSRPPTR
ncbi:MAG: SDR family oxidoreductase [Trueperaceae bacterium]|nr:SDR family oxidoreductase [Trueperaceae bacterium]